MRLPNAENHETDPLAVADLMQSTGMGTTQLSRVLGLSTRTLQCYKAQGETHVPIPYPVQFALEALASVKQRKDARRAARAGVRRG